VEKVIILPSFKKLKLFKHPDNNYDQIIEIQFEDHGKGMMPIENSDKLPMMFDIFAYSVEDTSTLDTQWRIVDDYLDVEYESSLENTKLEDTLAYQNLRFNSTFFSQEGSSIFFLIEFKHRQRVS
jgi:hypothetical protein